MHNVYADCTICREVGGAIAQLRALQAALDEHEGIVSIKVARNVAQLEAQLARHVDVRNALADFPSALSTEEIRALDAEDQLVTSVSRVIAASMAKLATEKTST